MALEILKIQILKRLFTHYFVSRFHNGVPISCHNFGENQELCDKLSLCKSNLRLKNKQIKLLKENLRKACSEFI